MDERKNLIVWFCATLAVLMAIGSLTVGVLLNHATTVQIQSERYRNTRAACEKGNVQNRVLVGFIEQSIPKAKLKDPRVVAYLARAHKTWPQTDCDALVLKSIKGVNK